MSDALRRLLRPPQPACLCSFCGKAAHEVEVMIAGPSVCICDGCLELCCAIVVERRQKATETKAARP